ncbi:unnamed protein product [Urochloa humidicola]
MSGAPSSAALDGSSPRRCRLTTSQRISPIQLLLPHVFLNGDLHAHFLISWSMTICGAEGGAAGNDLDADPSHSIASRSSSAAPQSLGTIIARCQTICLFLKSFASGEVHT